MSTARDQIFGRLKAALDTLHNPTVRVSGADQRIKAHAPGLIPKRGQTQGPARVAEFVSEAERANAQVVRLGTLAEVPRAVAQVLAAVGADRIKIAPHPVLKALDWSGVESEFGVGVGDDPAGLGLAVAGVAETGTLVLTSGPDTPTRSNFLPDTHMVVLKAADIEANYEAVWTRLRELAPAGGPLLPRTVNWITGPSRTADIEQTILLGAHGPRKLVILLIDENA